MFPFQGFVYPSCYGLLRHWSITRERGRLVSGVLSGQYPCCPAKALNEGFLYLLFSDVRNNVLACRNFERASFVSGSLRSVTMFWFAKRHWSTHKRKRTSYIMGYLWSVTMFWFAKLLKCIGQLTRERGRLASWVLSGK